MGGLLVSPGRPFKRNVTLMKLSQYRSARSPCSLELVVVVVVDVVVVVVILVVVVVVFDSDSVVLVDIVIVNDIVYAIVRHHTDYLDLFSWDSIYPEYGAY